jgi:hypothetical protein
MCNKLVEPPEPMKGLDVPPDVAEALGSGKRPPVCSTQPNPSLRAGSATTSEPASGSTARLKPRPLDRPLAEATVAHEATAPASAEATSSSAP